MIVRWIIRRFGFVPIGIALVSISGCGFLHPKGNGDPAQFTLGAADELTGSPLGQTPTMGAGPVLIIAQTTSAAGFESARMIYFRQPQTLEYFVHSRWVDSPAKMLGPYIAMSLEKSRIFSGILLSPSAATGDLMLETHLLELQQEFFFVPSREHFILRATMVDLATGQLIASREFNEVVDAPHDGADGGIIAAHQAVHAVIVQLTRFCEEVAYQRSPLLPATSRVSGAH